MNLKNYKNNEIKIYYKITTEKTQSANVRSSFVSLCPKIRLGQHECLKRNKLKVTITISSNSRHKNIHLSPIPKTPLHSHGTNLQKEARRK